MTDVVEIAKKRRAELAAEIDRLDDFVRMAEMLLKSETHPATGAGWFSDPLERPAALSQSDRKESPRPDDKVSMEESRTERNIGAPAGTDSAAATDRNIQRNDATSGQNFFAPPAKEEKELVLKEEARAASESDAAVGQKLRQRRWMMGISKTELAEQLGVTAKEIQNFELGVTHVDTNRLYKLAVILDVSPSYFFGEDKQALTDAGKVDADRPSSETRSSEESALAKSA